MPARIFMVADSFDALCSERPYKKAFDYEEVMKIIHQETETHFDPHIVRIFSSVSKEIYDELARLGPDKIKELVLGRVDLIFYHN
jgi:HD-GYP domain-containing protein (c-di-GMP phosphodiesterase class II)